MGHVVWLSFAVLHIAVNLLYVDGMSYGWDQHAYFRG